MPGLEPDIRGEPDFDRGKAATEKALSELMAARTASQEARREKANHDIGFSLVKLILGATIGSGLGWLYWTTENRWAFFGAAVLGLGPVLGAVRKLYSAIGVLKDASREPQ